MFWRLRGSLRGRVWGLKRREGKTSAFLDGIFQFDQLAMGRLKSALRSIFEYKLLFISFFFFFSHHEPQHYHAHCYYPLRNDGSVIFVY